MAENSAIEWTDHTFNPWWGCAKVSPACDRCYAEAWAKRTGHGVWGPRAPRRLFGDDHWRRPLRWNRDAARSGRRARVFCASMADVFEWRADLRGPRRRLWALVEATPNLDWLLLTKRPHLARRLAPWGTDWPDHVWLGATVENQRFAGKRIPFLLDTPSRYRFLSCEPLLGPIDLAEWIDGLDWVIAGGESGAGARPAHPDWIRGLRDQCAAAGAAFHFKQWGAWRPVRGADEKVSFVRMGKKTAGRDLDGRTWDELPRGYSDRTGLRRRPAGGGEATEQGKTAG